MNLRKADPGQGVTEEDRLDWRARALHWLDPDLLNQGEYMAALQKPLHRLVSENTLVALDNALLQTVGKGLAAFVDPGQDKDADPEPQRPGRRWPTLTLHTDRGPTSWCAVWFMMFGLRLNLVVLPDFSHDVWNDVKNAVFSIGWGAHLHAFTWVMNVPFGPWEGSKWFRIVQEGCTEALAVAAAWQDPLFQESIKSVLLAFLKLVRAVDDASQSICDDWVCSVHTIPCC